MILEIDNVELYFNNKRLLNGIYLKAEIGKVTSILGSNGSGKSCLLQIAFGVLKAKYSLIRINQKPILKPLFLTKSIVFLPQHHLTPNNMKVSSAFKLFQVDWDVFISDFSQFEIFKNKIFHRLSGGERRLLEIYLILKKEAKIVLLDEPFNGIEPLFIEKIKRLITSRIKIFFIIVIFYVFIKILYSRNG